MRFRYRFIEIMVTMILSVSLFNCGSKGNLYMPGRAPSNQESGAIRQ